MDPPSYLARVDIVPPELNYNGGRVLLNSNKTMIPRAPQNEKSNHNIKMKAYPFLFFLHTL
jgi:hypothetical protein